MVSPFGLWVEMKKPALMKGWLFGLGWLEERGLKCVAFSAEHQDEMRECFGHFLGVDFIARVNMESR
jgi:hypothetical protein